MIDKYTIEIKTKNIYEPLLNHLSHPGAMILNKRAVEEYGNSYGQNPIGTGPYMFDL